MIRTSANADPLMVWASTPCAPARAWYPIRNKPSHGPQSRPPIIPNRRGFPETRHAPGCSSSNRILLYCPCPSATHISVAPPSNAPSTAALTSRVMSSRARSYSPDPGLVCSGLITPLIPSISAEIKMRIAFSVFRTRAVAVFSFARYHAIPAKLPEWRAVYDHRARQTVPQKTGL